MNESNPLTAQREQWEEKRRSRNTFRIQFSGEAGNGFVSRNALPLGMLLKSHKSWCTCIFPCTTVTCGHNLMTRYS